MNLQHTLDLLFDGMQGVRRTSFITAAAAMALAGIASAQSHQIGLKLGQNGNGNQQGADPAALLPTDMAGAPGYAQTNWNVLGRWGDNGTNAFGTNSYPVIDNNGDNTYVTINWDAGGIWSVANGGAPVNQGSPDGNLMNPYDDSNGGANAAMVNGSNIYGQPGNNKPMVYLAGLQAWLATEGASQYDLVVYMDGDATSGRAGIYWLQNVSGAFPSLTYGTDMTTHTILRDFNNFTANPTYQRVPAASNNGRVAGSGNYAVFTGLTADALVLRTEEFNFRCGINAVQIVPRTSPIGPELDPLLAASTYTGGTATFTVNAAGVLPMSYQWKKGVVSLVDGGNISGSSTATLTITGASAADQASYSVVVTGPNGSTTSTAASLTVAPVTPGSYAEKIATNNPVAYWRLNESADPSTGFVGADDAIGGFNGIYGTLAQNGFNGIAGPRPPGFPGFEAGNSALQTFGNTTTPLPYPSSYVNWVVAPPLNIATNTVTIAAWIFPTAFAEPGFCAFISERGSSDVCNFGYGNGNNLGYTWNGAANTYNFVSGLVPASNQWSFVALVLSPTNAIIYLYNTNGQFAATNTVSHPVDTWTNVTMLGDDPASTGTPQGRAFTGDLDELAVFTHCLSDQDLYSIYKKGLNVGIIPASIGVQPVSKSLYAGRTASFTVAAAGDKPFTYQWRTNGVNLPNGGRIAGANSATLFVTNVSAADAASYDVVVDNVAHAPVASSPAALTVVPEPSPLSGYEAALQAANPLYYWRFNEPALSPYAYDYWGGNIATNDNAASGAVGPTPPDFPGFEVNNAANSYDGLTSATETGLIGVNNNLAQFSIAGWFNAVGPIGLRVGLFGQNDVTEFGFHGQDPYAATGLGELGIWTPGGATYLSQTNVVPGQWYYVAAVGDGSGVSLYLFTTNGSGGFQVAQSTTPSVTTNYGASTYGFNIGGDGVLDPTGNYFTGLIDEVALWHRALSVGELSSLFAAGIGVSALAPQITVQPAPQALYAGRTATFSVTAVGSAPLSYQWLKNGAPVTDGNASGATAATLTIATLVPGNIGNYDVVITNSAGSVTSSIVALNVITPTPAGYESALLAMSPLAYYRLNETNDPATGTAVNNDYWGGHAGLYGVGASNKFNGIFGPVPPNFTFEAGNGAIETGAGVIGSWATAPFGSLGTNTVTMCMWIKPTGTFDTYAGLLVNRGGGSEGGFGFVGPTAGQLGYTWNNNSGTTYGFQSGLVPPLNEWSFVALVVASNSATIYMYNTQGELSATNVLAHTSDVFGNNWRIGKDFSSGTDDGSRTFTGQIDEVAVFTHSLTGAQLRQLYVAGAVGVADTLNIQLSGGNVILTWPYGMLLQAPAATGPWTPVPGNPPSPYTVAPAGAMQFYRVQVQ